MNIYGVNVIRIVMKIALWMLVMLAVTSCATISQYPGPQLSPAPLPSYSKGTTYVYTGGKWETVIDTLPDAVTWKNHRNHVSSGPADFTFNRTKWKTKNRHGTREFGPRSDLLTQSATTLWPLRAGNFVTYSETGSWSDKKKGSANSYETAWSCEVVGTEKVSVMAGEFDTWKIVGKRYNISRRKSRSYLREVKTWYYAPKVGHYVLTTVRYYYPKDPRRLELVAVLPPLDDFSNGVRRQIHRSFQQALEFKKRGESVRWSHPKLGISGETLPINTFKTPNGTFSRRYVQTLKSPVGQKTYYGMAVRDSGGVWRVMVDSNGQ